MPLRFPFINRTCDPTLLTAISIFTCRIMVRSSYHLLFGLLSPSNHYHDGSLSSREDVIQFLSQQADIKTTMKLITAPSAPAELLKMDSVSFALNFLLLIIITGFVQSLEFLKKSRNLRTTFPDLEKVWKLKTKS